MVSKGAAAVVHALAATRNLKVAGPPGNPDRRCFGPNCLKPILRRYHGKSRYWKHLGPSFGYKGNDYFCSLQCATDWAVIKCDAGGSDYDDAR